MNFPRLKNALLCRVLIYVAILGVYAALAVAAVQLAFLSGMVTAVLWIGLTIALLIYLVKNAGVLVTMDLCLATLYCCQTARKQFVLPRDFSVQRVERKFSRFGKAYEPAAYSPRPDTLRCRSRFPVKRYASGIEKVVAAYDIDFLDEDRYRRIVRSAAVNANALKGTKKHIFLGKKQKNAPINQVTVILIYAGCVEAGFREKLFETVCGAEGDGLDVALLPCVVNLERRTCTFDSIRLPYIGFQYPVKNRGIRIIRKYLFHGRFPLSTSTDRIDTDFDLEQSLWHFWRATKKELILDGKQMKKRFEGMRHGDIAVEDGYLYLKWGDRGVWRMVTLDEEHRIAEVDAIDLWEYPKPNKIAKDTVRQMKSRINTYFAGLGYTTKYTSHQ